MKKFGDWYMPDHEAHLPEWIAKKNDQWFDRKAYQGAKIRAALALLPSAGPRRAAIDIGAHVGLWSYYLAKFFLHVHAFEPIDEHRLCFRENVHADNVTLYPFGLGDEEGTVGFHTEPSSSGDTYVSGKGTVPIRRLDSLDIKDIDFIKADTEGWELFALRGGEPLIREFKPVIVVEQKPGKATKFGLGETDAVEYLQEIGYRLVREISGDFFMVAK